VLKISQQRATAVKRSLEALIGNSTITARILWDVQGRGGTQLLIANPRTEAERARNRRVEIVMESGAGPALNNVADTRINVFAQRALLRMFAGDAGARADATGILAAVKAGQLAGIYKEDERMPLLYATKLKLSWWQLIPKGEDAALVLAQANLQAPPIIAFRDQVRSISSRLDRALRRAWNSFRLWKTGRLMRCPIRPAGVISAGAQPASTSMVSNLMPLIFCSLPTVDPCLVAFPVPPALNKRVRELTKEEARDIVIHLIKLGAFTLRTPPAFGATCKRVQPGATTHVIVDPPIINSVEIVSDSGAKRGSPLFDLDMRMLVLLFYLARMLRTTWGVTEIHHLGIGSTGTHVGRLAMDFAGVAGTISGSSSPGTNGPYSLNVLSDWGNKPVELPSGARGGQWPGGKFTQTKYRLDPQQNKYATAFTVPKDFLAFAIFRDVYTFATMHCFDSSNVVSANTVPTTIGSASRWIIHPDHPGAALRSAHTNHMHFEIPL